MIEKSEHIQKISLFDKELSVTTDEIEIQLREKSSISWSDFVLNPRRLRGSDFLMRWSQGVWSEHRIVEGISKTANYFALPYGPSGTAPHDDVREYELYFERLDQAGHSDLKRPDLLIFSKQDEPFVNETVAKLGGVQELPFIPEENDAMKLLISRAIVAVECENSLWKAKQMPEYASQFTPQKRLGGRPGLKKTAVLPTVIVKEEDLSPLKKWQQKNGIPIHVWHVFYDLAFGIAFETVEKLVSDGLIQPTVQVFQAPGGATTKKTIYKIYYQYAYSLGEAKEAPKLSPAHIVDKNGHILPFVKFEGGSLSISQDALAVLDKIRSGKNV